MANTAYNDQGKSPCDSDTRIDILADIKEWVNDISDGAQTFLRLTGDPGSGKSAITASIARDCKDNGILWAQFFINRNLGNTTNPAFYFPSIARQLADHSPDVAFALHDALKEQPSLMDDISQLQAGKLFVESVKVASSTTPSKPVVIIIDGLDETDATRLRFTARIFSRALIDLPSHVKVFISSRTEDDIRKPFSATFHVNHVKHIHLDTSSDSSIRDVSTFLAKNMADIVDRNNLDVLEWPGERRMVNLCNQASGLFIWAVTAIKFIQDQVDACGKECLNDVFNELNSKGMGDINVLYGTILRIAHRTQTDPWVFERFRRIVGCIVVLQLPLCLTDIRSLLNLRKNLSSDAVDIEHHVRRLRTVLVAGTDAINGQTVPRLHKSFYEFIISEQAEPRFRIDTEKSHGEVAIQCLNQLIKMSNDNAMTANDRAVLLSPQVPMNKMLATELIRLRGSSKKEATAINHIAGSCFSPLHRYVCEFWTSHLPSSVVAGVIVVGSHNIPELQEFFRFSCHGGDQPLSVHITLFSDRKHIVSSSKEIINLWDVESGMTIECPFRGHTGYVSSVAFSPDGKQIISGSRDNTLRLWNAHSGQPVGLPFKGHTKSVNSIAFSPDGKQIISGSSDQTLRLWDAQNGQPIGSPFKGHTGPVYSVAFSPDGTLIMSGAWDRTVLIWNVCRPKEIELCLKADEFVSSVAFSSDGKKIVSGDCDHEVRLWNARSGQLIGTPLIGHYDTVNAVAFSPDGKQIISGSRDSTLRLWDAQSGLPIGSPFYGHTGVVHSVAFSPDGKQIISSSRDHTLRLWDTRSGKSIGQPFVGHTGTVYSAVFSPDGKQVISGSADRTLRLWDVSGHCAIERPFKGHISGVTSLVLSPDDQMLVSASLDNTIRVWDVRTGTSIKLPFICDDKGIISLAFSPDGSVFAAAASDGTLCLWAAETQRCIASYHIEHFSKMTTIGFSVDGRQLTAVSIDGATQTWDAASGKTVGASPRTVLFDSSRSLVFSLERGWYTGNTEMDNTLLRVFPVEKPDFGHWAYINDKLIRSDRNGSTIITDMSENLRQWHEHLADGR